MDQGTRGALESAGVLLAALTGGLHLMIGLPRFTLYLMAGQPFLDVRQVLFVLSGVAVFLGVTLWYMGLRRDVVYGAGILLMLGYLVGWLVLGGHGNQFAWQGGHHAGSPLVTLFEHLVSEWQLLLTKLTESTLLVVLVALLYDELTRDDARATDAPASGDGTNSGDADAN
ncbi:hypothetical protein [Halostella litorea]|uniref:hypothetical protein n=1 Tax=Halostella litorea TaxID=2528831 RepID=UPI00109285FB|nr:hypothetical protein [Halostella litorea]